MADVITPLIRDFEYDKAFTWYRLHAPDGFVKNMLSKGETPFNREKLKHELQKMQGQEIKKAETASLEKKASVKKLEEKYSYSHTDSETVKALHKEWKPYYAEKNFLRARLRSLFTDKERMEAAGKILVLRDQCIAIWAKLDYYKIHGSLPTDPEVLKIATDDSVRLITRRNTLRVYLSEKRRKKLTAIRMAAYESELKSIQLQLDNYAH